MDRLNKFDYLLDYEQEAYDKIISLINQYVMPWAKAEVINAIDELVEALTGGNE